MSTFTEEPLYFIAHGVLVLLSVLLCAVSIIGIYNVFASSEEKPLHTVSHEEIGLSEHSREKSTVSTTSRTVTETTASSATLIFHKQSSPMTDTANKIKQDVSSSTISSLKVITPLETSLEEDTRDQTKQTPKTSAATQPLIGVHAINEKDADRFAAYIKKPIDMLAIHLHWGNENMLPPLASWAQDHNATLFIFWNPMDYSKKTQNQSEFHYTHILEGDWDTYINDFKKELVSYGKPVILAPFEEINGNWVPWSGYTKRYGTIAEYKAAFSYLRKKFTDVPTVRFAWVVNHVSVPNTPENALLVYAPDSMDYDLIGINAFNFGDPWLSFDELVTDAIETVKPLKKPIYITSTASAEGPQKNKWITDMEKSVYFRDGTLKGWLWFNENKERNWLIWSNQ